MQIEVKITNQRIIRAECLPTDEKTGAVVEFSGVVRGLEDDRPILGLEYEAYEEMAVKVMNQLLAELGETHVCLSARVVHRIGFIPVGEVAIYIVVTAAHRGEAFSLMTSFIDRLKLDVPIWKVHAVPAGEEPEVKR